MYCRKWRLALCRHTQVIYYCNTPSSGVFWATVCCCLCITTEAAVVCCVYMCLCVCVCMYMCVHVFVYVCVQHKCVRLLPTLSLFVNMHTLMCTKMGVGTYECVCECLDNLVCMHSRSGSVYLYMCASVYLRPLFGFWLSRHCGDFVGGCL